MTFTRTRQPAHDRADAARKAETPWKNGHPIPMDKREAGRRKGYDRDPDPVSREEMLARRLLLIREIFQNMNAGEPQALRFGGR